MELINLKLLIVESKNHCQVSKKAFLVTFTVSKINQNEKNSFFKFISNQYLNFLC